MTASEKELLEKSIESDKAKLEEIDSTLSLYSGEGPSFDAQVDQSDPKAVASQNMADLIFNHDNPNRISEPWYEDEKYQGAEGWEQYKKDLRETDEYKEFAKNFETEGAADAAFEHALEDRARANITYWETGGDDYVKDVKFNPPSAYIDCLRDNDYNDEIVSIEYYLSPKELEQQRREILNEISKKQDELNEEELMKEKQTYHFLSLKRDKEASNMVDIRNINGLNFRQGEENDVNYAPSRSYTMNKDFLITDTLSLYGAQIETSKISQIVHHLHEHMKDMPNIQPLILNEFQPYDMLSPADLMPNDLFSKIGEGLNQAATFLGGNVIISLGKNVLMKSQIDKYSKDPTLLYNTSYDLNGVDEINLSTNKRRRKYFTSDPVQVIHNMFNGGKWLNTFQIPYYGNEYLNAEFSSLWQSSDSSRFFGGLAGQSVESTTGGAASVGTKGFGIDFPSNPKFDNSGSLNASKKTIKSEFFLVNTNTNWLIRNFEFIQAFFSGTSWIHMKYCQIRPPNVYHVLCPGRFQMFWAAMDVTITFEGKLRKNPKAVELIKNKFSNKIKVLKKGVEVEEDINIINSLDEDMLWPEAWKVSVLLTDLTPNNFNLYADYYQYGFRSDEVFELEQQLGLSEVLDQAKSYFTEVFNELKRNVEDGLGSIYQSITGKEYDSSKPLSTVIGELSAGFETTLGKPVKDAFGMNEDKNKLKLAQSELNSLVDEYRDENGNVNWEELNNDARYEERLQAFHEANVKVQTTDNIAAGMSEDEAKEAANKNSLQGAAAGVEENARIQGYVEDDGSWD